MTPLRDSTCSGCPQGAERRFWSSMQVKPHSALVLIGHGSTLNPDSSTPTMDHAETIRQRGVFGQVVCAFWKEEPSLREVLRMVDSEEVYVVPNFISEGYFTQQVSPRELGLTVWALRAWRRKGYGPAASKIGRLVVYRSEEVADFIEDQAEGRA